MSRYEEHDDIRTALLNMYGLGRQMTPRPKKEMTTRELLEQQLAGYDDDMEPRTPKPRVELKSDGSTFTLYRNGKPVSFWPAFGSEDIPEMEFDGQTLTAINNEKTLKSWPAMSGKPGYQSRAATEIENHGPIPEGVWHLNPDELQTYSPEKESRSWRGPNGETPWQGGTRSWGNYRIRLEPDDFRTDTKHREGFYLHGGEVPGSAGCIDTTDSMDEVAKFIRASEYPMDIYVNYKYDDWNKRRK